MNQPLDADAVLRDDALFDALARGELPAEFHDDPTSLALLGWRDDLVDSPFTASDVTPNLIEPTATAELPPELSAILDGPLAGSRGSVSASAGRAQVPVTGAGTPAEAAEPGSAVRAGAPRERPAGTRYRGLSRRVTVAAAAGVFMAGSLGSVAAASVAEPGSPLWLITKVVYAERAESREARDSALFTLRQARDAAEQHRPQQAKELLELAMQQAGRVRESDDRAEITNRAAEVKQVIAAFDDPPVTTTPDAQERPDAPAQPSLSPSPGPQPTSPPSSTPAPKPSSPADPSSPPVPNLPVTPTPLATTPPGGPPNIDTNPSSPN